MGIIVDSACDLSKDIINKLKMKISSVPLSLQIEDKHFVDDEHLDIDTFIQEMQGSNAPARTAAPSPELFLQKFKEEGSSFVVTVSSKLSASYSNAMLAKDMYIEEMGNKFIHVFDSLSASVGETLIAMKIHEFHEKNLNDSEIVKHVNDFIHNMRTFCMLEKYDNLAKNGRVNQYVAKLAKMLSIRPICVAQEGEIIMKDKAKGTKKAITKIVDMMASEKLDFESRVLGISHVRCLENALMLKEEVEKKIDFKDIFIVETAGLCTTYAEKNGLIISY